MMTMLDRPSSETLEQRDSAKRSARSGWARRVRRSINAVEAPDFCDCTFLCESGGDGEGGDLIASGGGKQQGGQRHTVKAVHAVKGMLACHSEVFARMFFAEGFREGSAPGGSQGERLTLRVPWSQRALSRVVAFLLTGELATTRDDVLEQILLADHFAITPLLDALVTMVVQEEEYFGFSVFGPGGGFAMSPG